MIAKDEQLAEYCRTCDNAVSWARCGGSGERCIRLYPIAIAFVRWWVDYPALEHLADDRIVSRSRASVGSEMKKQDLSEMAFL